MKCYFQRISEWRAQAWECAQCRKDCRPEQLIKLYLSERESENDLVRDFNTTIKFDRVLSTSRVKDWTALASYVYGDLIRYNNELYRATSAFTATSDFDENEDKVQRIYGDETGLTASDRTKGFYTPGDGMPGNELNQLMDGVDYGGTMVTGLLFNEGKGWNNFSWDTVGWDRFNTSNIQTFYADGSTATYTFKTAPASSKAYQVYVSDCYCDTLLNFISCRCPCIM